MVGIEQGQSRGGEKPNFFPDPETLRNRLEGSLHKDAILNFLAEHGVALKDFLVWSERGSLYLSDLGILRHFLAGNIIIHPFDIRNLTPNSYEVSLGEYFYRQGIKWSSRRRVTYESPRHAFAPSPLEPEEPFPILNPFDPKNISFVWRLHQALEAQEFLKKHQISLEGVQPGDRIIVINPSEEILAHTQEFIGGRHVVSTMISARSSTGRNLLEVCSDANLGHVGFCSRWTLELTNKSDKFAIPLVVGERYAQISFLEIESAAQSYHGQYQTERDLEAIVASWKPEMMLPRMSRRTKV